MSETHYDVVVIGSGFGGSISALRLAEAGRSVLVLERGRRYRPEDFPREVTDTRSLLWRYPRKPAYRGLFEFGIFSDIGVVTASGVGGGSLIYANIHIRPDPAVFEHPRWPAVIDRATLEPYFDRVAEMLGVSPTPPELSLPKRDRFREAAARLGRSVFDPDQAVSWTDPSTPGRSACAFLAECEFGCPVGAKNTMDFTYLAGAEALGAELRAGCNVTRVAADPQGYRVHFDSVSDGMAGSVTGTRVVLAAGTLGTNAILLASRDRYRTLPNLSDRLGYGFSGNGDFLGSIQNSDEPLEPWYGPDVTSVMRYTETEPGFTLAAPTFNREVMAVLASLGQRSISLPRFLRRPLWRRLDGLLEWALRRGHLSKPLARPGPGAGDPGHMTNLFAIGRDNANGRIQLDGDRLDIRWDYERENARLIDRMQATLHEVGEIYGGSASALVTWQLFRRILTVHPLGGCHLSDTPRTGVVSPDGEVHSYPGLFVADGSVIPTSLGFHPVMTISALAERTAEAVAASFGA